MLHYNSGPVQACSSPKALLFPAKPYDKVVVGKTMSRPALG